MTRLYDSKPIITSITLRLLVNSVSSAANRCSFFVIIVVIMSQPSRVSKTKCKFRFVLIFFCLYFICIRDVRFWAQVGPRKDFILPRTCLDCLTTMFIYTLLWNSLEQTGRREPGKIYILTHLIYHKMSAVNRSLDTSTYYLKSLEHYVLKIAFSNVDSTWSAPWKYL